MTDVKSGNNGTGNGKSKSVFTIGRKKKQEESGDRREGRKEKKRDRRGKGREKTDGNGKTYQRKKSRIDSSSA